MADGLRDWEYAMLSDNVYGHSTAVSSTLNRVPTPGWSVVAQSANPEGFTSLGFLGLIFKKDGASNEFALSFGGTTFETLADWPYLNSAAVLTQSMAPQIVKAAKLYLDFIDEHPGAQVTFTGHSGGGGGAAVLGVLFDRPVVAFDTVAR